MFKDIALRAFGISFVLFALANGSYMLVSPQRWRNLPTWLGGPGRSRLRYASAGGEFQVRVIGAAIVGIVTTICYRMLFL
jgi:hypothetical protein